MNRQTFSGRNQNMKSDESKRSPSPDGVVKQLKSLIDELGIDEFLRRARSAPKPPMQEAWLQVGESMNIESNDRVLAIVAVAFLDDVLGELLNRRVADVDKSTVKRAIPATGSFASRIDLATVVGLLADEEASDLRTLNKIRNRFAHRALSLTFEDSDIQTQCQSLHLIKNAEADGQPIDWRDWKTRDIFRLAVYAITNHLKMMIPTVPRLNSKKFLEWPFSDPLDCVDSWAGDEKK